MKKLSLYVFLILMFYNLTNISKAEEIEAFCLVKRSDLINAKLRRGDHSRFVGKEIYFIIDFDENIISDFSEDSAMSVITGMYGPLDAKEFKKTSLGIKYNNEIDVKGFIKDQPIKYKYDNGITIVNGKPTSFYAWVEESVFHRWNFQIDCRDYKYSEAEKRQAKKKNIPEVDKSLVEKIIKSKVKTGPTIVVFKSYAVNNQDDLLYLYKAKFFENKPNKGFKLANTIYLNFKTGQVIYFDDVKDLNETEFFGLLLQYEEDRSALIRLKSEHLKEKRKLIRVLKRKEKS